MYGETRVLSPPVFFWLSTRKFRLRTFVKDTRGHPTTTWHSVEDTRGHPTATWHSVEDTRGHPTATWHSVEDTGGDVENVHALKQSIVRLPTLPKQTDNPAFEETLC